MTWETLSLEFDGHVAHLTLDRPNRLNAMNAAFWQEMVEAFAAIDAEPKVRAVVLSSSGRHFTAGLDLKEFGPLFGALKEGEQGRVAERVRRTVKEMQETCNVIERCRTPVLAAIQGGCIGGGVDMVAAADMRYCTADAFFQIQEINIGIVADVGTLQRLPHLIPAGLVRELAYTGRRLAAEDALAAGLVNRVFEDHEAMVDEVMAIAREIAAKSPLSIVGTKEMLTFARDHPVADGLNYVATWQAGMLLSADLDEAVRAHREKRTPEFEDLLPGQGIVRRGP